MYVANKYLCLLSLSMSNLLYLIVLIVIPLATPKSLANNFDCADVNGALKAFGQFECQYGAEAASDLYVCTDQQKNLTLNLRRFETNMDSIDPADPNWLEKIKYGCRFESISKSVACANAGSAGYIQIKQDECENGDIAKENLENVVRSSVQSCLKASRKGVRSKIEGFQHRIRFEANSSADYIQKTAAQLKADMSRLCAPAKRYFQSKVKPASPLPKSEGAVR